MESCDILRKKRRQTRVGLIGVASAGFVLIGAGLLEAAANPSISGSGGGSALGDAAAVSGLLFFLTGTIGYAVSIPRLNKKYRHCLK